MYVVKDSLGKYLATFPSYQEAHEFRMTNGRPDWEVKGVYRPFRRSTDKQRRAVLWTESLVQAKFIGNLENYEDCNKYLSQYFYLAKSIH